MIIDIVSITAGVISVILAIYAICFAKKESHKSEECYRKTCETLEEIKQISELNFQATGYTEEQLKSL